jgi:hypothetical protein
MAEKAKRSKLQLEVMAVGTEEAGLHRLHRVEDHPARSKAVNASGSLDRWIVNVSSLGPSVYGVFAMRSASRTMIPSATATAVETALSRK